MCDLILCCVLCEIVCLGKWPIGKKMLNTRVSVRTSCLRNFGHSSSELNEKKSVLKKFFLRFYSV